MQCLVPCFQINVVFLCFSVRSLWKSKQLHWSSQEMKKKAKVITLAKWESVAAVGICVHESWGIVFGNRTKDNNRCNFRYMDTLELYSDTNNEGHSFIWSTCQTPFCQQVHFESNCHPSSPAWANLGVWNSNHWPQYHRVCLALHHLQLHPGLCHLCHCVIWVRAFIISRPIILHLVAN